MFKRKKEQTAKVINKPKQVLKKAGVTTMEYIIVLIVIVIGLISVLTAFKDQIADVIGLQGDNIADQSYNSYCISRGLKYSGNLEESTGKPICN